MVTTADDPSRNHEKADVPNRQDHTRDLDPSFSIESDQRLTDRFLVQVTQHFELLVEYPPDAPRRIQALLFPIEILADIAGYGSGDGKNGRKPNEKIANFGFQKKNQ